MISKSEYAKISKNWTGRIYQRMETEHVKLAHLEKYMKYFKDKDVVEPGCNAGLFGYHIAQHAKSYVGVEPKDAYYEQAAQTVKYMGDNSTVIHKSLEYFGKECDNPYNATFMCYVMYHFRKDDMQVLTDIILPKCDVVVAFNRNTKRRKDKNKYNFERMANVVGFLENQGFTCKSEMEKLKRFHIVVGKK